MTVHRITERAAVTFGGAQTVHKSVQVDDNLGIVACDAGFQSWTFTPIHVTPTSVTAGTAWTPADVAAPFLQDEQFIGLGGGIAVYLRSWGIEGVGAGPFIEIFVLTTDGSTITVDSDTIVTTAFGIVGVGAAMMKNAALAFNFGSFTTLGGTIWHHATVSSGSISVTSAVGPNGLFIRDGYTIGVGSGGDVSVIDGSGAVGTVVSTGLNTPTYLPLGSNKAAITGSFAGPTPGYALITVDPLTLDFLSGPIAAPPPAVTNGPTDTSGTTFCRITGSPSGEAWYFWPDQMDPSLTFKFPPGDEAWAATGLLTQPFPDVFSFGYSPVVTGWDHSDDLTNFDDLVPRSYVDGTLGNWINKVAYDFWAEGVGDGTVVAIYTDSLPVTTVAVWSVVPVAGPTARLTVTPPVGTSPDTVTLDGHLSSSPLPPPLTYGWDFGDGAMAAGSTSQSHTYTTAVPHVFSATLTVRDWFGQEDSVSEPVTVGPAVAPPQRAFPRDDGLGMSTRRSFPPPTSDQYGIRRAPGEWYR